MAVVFTGDAAVTVTGGVTVEEVTGLGDVLEQPARDSATSAAPAKAQEMIFIETPA